MTASKTSENWTSYQHLSSFRHTLLSNRHRLTHSDVLSTDIPALTPAVSNICRYDGNAHCNNIGLRLV